MKLLSRMVFGHDMLLSDRFRDEPEREVSYSIAVFRENCNGIFTGGRLKFLKEKRKEKIGAVLDEPNGGRYNGRQRQPPGSGPVRQKSRRNL